MCTLLPHQKNTFQERHITPKAGTPVKPLLYFLFFLKYILFVICTGTFLSTSGNLLTIKSLERLSVSLLLMSSYPDYSPSLSYFPALICPSEKCCESLPSPSWEWSHPLSCCVLPIKAGSHCLSSGLAAPGTAAPARPHCDFRPHTDGPASKYSCTWLDTAPVGVAEWTWRSAYRPPQVLGVGGTDRAQMLR